MTTRQGRGVLAVVALVATALLSGCAVWEILNSGPTGPTSDPSQRGTLRSSVEEQLGALQGVTHVTTSTDPNAGGLNSILSLEITVTNPEAPTDEAACLALIDTYLETIAPTAVAMPDENGTVWLIINHEERAHGVCNRETDLIQMAELFGLERPR